MASSARPTANTQNNKIKLRVYSHITGPAELTPENKNTGLTENGEIILLFLDH